MTGDRSSGPPQLVAQREAGDDDQDEAFTDLLDRAEDVTADATECAPCDPRDERRTDPGGECER